jgi:hypothetical protein
VSVCGRTVAASLLQGESRVTKKPCNCCLI